MDAKIMDLKGDSSREFYNHFMEEQSLTKQFITEIKHEIIDLRKDLTHEISQIKLLYERDLKDSNKELEMRMYTFIVKTVMTAIGAIGALQAVFHFMR